ncbi:zinc-dependent alcohol dehydrogenase [Miltoncostaea marina]|uniref:zinc-dependent alcohol dehydrogenase n=1 Tax=Miltoncostaea marina TaxID=2843215 RepID=UPI001C3E4F89|nr:alcohol dehydrogenase catalytic domain-containing protein [Miltoncostaea marina]
MRTLMLHGAGDLRLEEVPDPRPGPGEVVVAVEAALTCATDAKMLAAGAHPALGPLPAPLGHEVAGAVAEVGVGVRGLREGDRVIVGNSAGCGRCPDCAAGRPNLCAGIVFLTGAFADRLRVPAPIVERNVHPIPAGMPPEVAAMAEPFACAVHTAARCGAVEGRQVLVLGGGVQGQLLTRLLAAAGAAVHVADPHADRRERALRMGAAGAHAVPRDPAGVAALRAALGDGRGAGLVVEAVGRPQAWQAAVALARPGGEVVLHGGCPAGSVVELPTGPLHYSEITIRGSFHHTPDAFRAALGHLSRDPAPARELLRGPIGLDGVAEALTAARGEKHPVRP